MKQYYVLTKPGIVYSHAMTAIAGLLFATHHSGVPFQLIFGTLFGICFIVAAYCVFNNILDSDIDAQMKRTKDRALPTHSISTAHAFMYGSVLFVLGTGILLFTTNVLTLCVALFGMFAYLALYTPAKRYTVHSTIIGTLSGAAPLVAGYTAVTNTLDVTAVILFLIMVAWQMVHFFAIAFYHLADYQAANIPVFPVRYGALPTKVLMLVYSFVFILAIYALYAGGGASFLFLCTLGSAALLWTVFCIYGFFTDDNTRWGKRLFFYSLFVIMLLSVALAVT